jgi:protoheme ferro-lyase
MSTQLRPPTGFVSDNESTFGTSGHEEMKLVEEDGGTRLHYIYELNIHKPLLRVIAKPLIGWFAMKSWEKAVIDRVRELVANPME